MIIYKLNKRSSNLSVAGSPKRFYPSIVTVNRKANLNYIAEKIRDQSSLPMGDIKSVLYNFVEKVKEQLLEGKSVNIDGLGTFSLSAKSKGVEQEEDFSAADIESVRICFRANKALRLTRHATRTSEKMTFVNVVDYLKALNVGLPAGEGTQDGPEDGNGNIAPGGGNTGGNTDDEA